MNKVCEYYKCDNEFKYRSNKKYCSRTCKQLAKDKRDIENKNKKGLKRMLYFESFLNKKRPYAKQKKNICEKCGFIPMHKCQLDVDHIDGNHNNNAKENLQTLCANCHRLKTFLNKDNF